MQEIEGMAGLEIIIFGEVRDQTTAKVFGKVDTFWTYQLPLDYSKVIISYLCPCFIAHEEVCGVSSLNLVNCLQIFTNGLVAYTSAYPIILQKEQCNTPILGSQKITVIR